MPEFGKLEGGYEAWGVLVEGNDEILGRCTDWAATDDEHVDVANLVFNATHVARYRAPENECFGKHYI
jgi:hypothetical protein